MIKVLILSLILINNVFASGKIILSSEEKKTVSDGDLIQLITDNNGHAKKILELRNKRLNNFLYVLDVNTDKDRIIVDVIVASAKPEERIDIKDIHFEIKNVNYQPQKISDIQEYIILNIPIHLPRSYIYLFVAIVIILSVASIIYLRRYRLKQQQRKTYLKKLERANELIKLLKAASKREDYANIYEQRREIMTMLSFNIEKFQKSMDTLNQFQFQKEWPVEQFNLFLTEFKDAIKNVGVQNGI
jgi:hypothetical protein